MLLLWFILIVHVRPLSVGLWLIVNALWPSAGRAVPLAFHLCHFYFSAVLVVRVPFPFGVWGRVWNSIVSVPDHCLFIYFGSMTMFFFPLILKLYHTAQINWNYSNYFMYQNGMSVTLTLTCWYIAYKVHKHESWCTEQNVGVVHPKTTTIS